MAVGEKATMKEKLIEYILNLTNEEVNTVIAFLTNTEHKLKKEKEESL